MTRIQGVYDNGMVTLEREAPAKQAQVTVIFHEGAEATRPKKKRSREEALAMLEELRGCIKWEGEFDFEKERDEYLNEKYGPFD